MKQEDTKKQQAKEHIRGSINIHLESLNNSLKETGEILQGSVFIEKLEKDVDNFKKRILRKVKNYFQNQTNGTKTIKKNYR